MINSDDECWCGQKWDGEKMCISKLDEKSETKTNEYKKTDI
jgi:hypothetical protein